MSPSKTARDLGRGLLLSALEKETILTCIHVIDDERFTIETQDWNSYWWPVYELGDKELLKNLVALYASWIAYLRSRHDTEKRREYCYRYFVFLDSLLAKRFDTDAYLWYKALQNTIGFECFGVTSDEYGTEILLAGTSTIRNPCYLLSKVKNPDVMDDSRFLPFITVPGSENPDLYFHYKQYSLSVDSDISLLLYPIVNRDNRTNSMKVLNKMASVIRYAADPWTNERGALLLFLRNTPPVRARDGVNPVTFG